MEKTYDLIIIGSGYTCRFKCCDLCPEGGTGYSGSGKGIYQWRTGSEHGRGG